MSDFGDTTSLEKTSLEAHVDLCAMRYGQLDQRLSGLEKKVDEVQREIIQGQKSIKTTMINTAGTIVVAVVGVIGTILVKF